MLSRKTRNCEQKTKLTNLAVLAFVVAHVDGGAWADLRLIVSYRAKQHGESLLVFSAPEKSNNQIEGSQGAHTMTLLYNQ